MRKSFIKLIRSGLFITLILGFLITPASVMAQEASEETTEDSVEVVEDNSSAFNDSVQFDDMEPVFYEATEDEEEATGTEEGMGGMLLYIGIAVVLIIVLIVLKKAGKKKA
jgi:hypothetical protein